MSQSPESSADNHKDCAEDSNNILEEPVENTGEDPETSPEKTVKNIKRIIIDMDISTEEDETLLGDEEDRGPAGEGETAPAPAPKKKQKPIEMPDDALDKAMDVMDDKKKFGSMIKKMKQDKTIIPNAIKMVNENQQLRRDVTGMAKEVDGRKATQSMSFNEKKKILNKQDMMKSMMKKKITPGAVSCVYVYANGKIMSTDIIVKDIDDGDWSLHPIIIDKYCLVAVCDAKVLSGNNKTAGAIIGKPACGPVRFFRLDDKYESMDMSCAEFKSITAETIANAATASAAKATATKAAATKAATKEKVPITKHVKPVPNGNVPKVTSNDIDLQMQIYAYIASCFTRKLYHNLGEQPKEVQEYIQQFDYEQFMKHQRECIIKMTSEVLVTMMKQMESMKANKERDEEDRIMIGFVVNISKNNRAEIYLLYGK
jgi:hypothetical protein